METALIVFSSSVSGNRLKNSAQRAQIKNVRITQTPSAIKSGGCSYSLRVEVGDLENILLLARRNGIRYSAVYKESHDISGTPIYQRL